MAAGAKVDAADKVGRTPLCLATEHGDEACVSMLVEAGADVDAADQDGWTPLHWAAWCGHEACVSMLVKAGANPGTAASDGDTPILQAHRRGHIGIVAVLQGTSRWRRRRALALIREQREAGSDWRKAKKEWKHSKVARS